MKLVHVIDLVKEEVIDVYFIDKITGEKIDYTIEEFKESIKKK
ncbi:hypothetical protein [Clostridium perfringens]|nr:hypothetical protein [Clostridium perfringens]MDM0781759.1 hypothetical protein [Clostridium perfringens]MDM0867350.1 hypothetical protein [Clostridium perfringens]MDM0878167.1 hypothetical protein [Clostridium perfringens]MDM0920033.1 hypothetical protein [Clostridium perfringens]